MQKFKKDSYSARAVAYAKSVITGKLPACLQVRQACQRFMDDFERKDIRYDVARADHICEFAENMVHVVGPLAGETINLAPFQIFIFVNIFGWVNASTNLRRFREAFVLLPRGSAKSTIAAIIGLYLTFLEGQGGAQGLCGATSMAQADAVFEPARQMVLKNPAFADEAAIEVMASSIYQLSTGSSFKRVIANTKDGGLPWCAIADELHQAKNGNQLAAFRTGMGKRRGADPLLLIISTAGTNLAGVCRQEQSYFESVLAKTITDDSAFAIIYTIDKDDDWADFSVWKKANPAYGISVDEDHLRREYEKALQSPAAQADCLTKYLNVWVSSNSGWLNMHDWANAAEEIDFEALKGRPAGLGVDLSTLMDLTSVTVSVVLEDGRRALVPFSWVPSGSIAKSPNQKAYAQWIDSGDLLASEDKSIDLAAIEQRIEDLCAHFRVTAIHFDPKDAGQMQQSLLIKGHPVVTFGQNAMNYTPVMVEFEAALATGQIIHPANKVFDWCAANLSIRRDRNDNMHPQKPDGQQALKIDTMIAALMAFSASQVEAPDELSFEVAWFD